MTSPRTGTPLPVDGVLLDADDTLYDTRSAMHSAGAAAAAAVWPGADPERVRGAGVRFRDDPEGHFHAYARGEVEFDVMRRSRVADLVESGSIERCEASRVEVDDGDVPDLPRIRFRFVDSRFARLHALIRDINTATD